MKNEKIQLFIRGEIANFLRETRLQAGLSIEEAADKVGCTPSRIEKYEEATMNILTFEVIHIVTAYLGTPNEAAGFLQELSAKTREIMQSAEDTDN